MNQSDSKESAETPLAKALERRGNNQPDSGDTDAPTQFESSGVDEELANQSVPQYEDGHWQSAVQASFRVLEERVRNRGDFSPNETGTNLMTDAFHYEGGPLAFGETRSEKEGAMFLYCGVVQLLRNPASHRTLEEADEEYARDVIHTVNLLLRLLEINNPDSSSETGQKEF